MALVTKKQLADEVAGKTFVTKKEAELCINALFDLIEEHVAEGNQVRIHGFGTFEQRQRAERQGRNPQTGESITIAASTTMGFKATKSSK